MISAKKKKKNDEKLLSFSHKARDITGYICFTYQLTGFYMTRGFAERYFLTDRKPLLFRKCAQLLF